MLSQVTKISESPLVNSLINILSQVKSADRDDLTTSKKSSHDMQYLAVLYADHRTVTIIAIALMR